MKPEFSFVIYNNMIFQLTIFFFQPAPCNVAVAAEVPNGLASSVRYM